ncbi:MAG: hypothetical protein ACQETO_03300 [Pseudomonadota bacterium]
MFDYRILLAAGVAALMPFTVSASDDEVELVDNMSLLQYFSHKAALSIDARNRELADFYVHELEEAVEETGSVESYDGHAIGELSGAMLRPALENLEGALDDGEWPDVSQAFDAMIQSCNSCHQATEHGYIRIQRSSENPWMQDFSPLE